MIAAPNVQKNYPVWKLVTLLEPFSFARDLTVRPDVCRNRECRPADHETGNQSDGSLHLVESDIVITSIAYGTLPSMTESSFALA